MIDCKICGLGSFADLAVAEGAGAKWGGFVFYQESPRNISLNKARAIADEAIANNSTLTRVALVVDADDDQLDAVVSALRPGLIQCHGDESPDRISAIKSRYKIPVMKAVRVSSSKDIESALDYDDVADLLLFDSCPPNAELPGGTGQSFDWTLMSDFKANIPWMLAGGLNVNNIGTAISQSHARYVDVSSGVERKAGKKNYSAIKDLIALLAMPNEPT